MAQASLKVRGYMRWARRQVRGIERLFRSGPLLATLKDRPEDARITKAQLEDLRRAWANPGYEADLDYLEMVCDHAMAARDPVLECGSGLTTVLLALTAGRRGLPVWTLEHDHGWYRATRRVLKRSRLRGISLCNAPLVQRQGFAWYDAPLQSMPLRFGLVVCDGPPGSTPGGRSGLVPIMGTRLRGATILLDDAERPSEKAMMVAWAEAWGVTPQVWTTQSGSQVAALTLPHDRPPPGLEG